MRVCLFLYNKQYYNLRVKGILSVSLQQLPVFTALQHLHLLNSNLVEFYKSLALGDAVIDKNGIDILHVREADKFIDGGMVTDIAFWANVPPYLPA